MYSSNQRIRVAFLYYSLFSTFIRNDYEVLSNHFDVRKVNCMRLRDASEVLKDVAWSDITFSWFAGEHAFLAVVLSKILGKRSIVVAGGYDVACTPEINYGLFTMGWLKRAYASLALKRADIVLPVSKFTEAELLSRVKPKRSKVVYNGVDVNIFNQKGKKEDLVLTVAGGYGSVIGLKGIDTFIEASFRLAEVKFAVLGLSEKDFAKLASSKLPENVELQRHLPREELIGYYEKAKVYCQLSYRESFGLALAEAMACECVPVVTDRGALPEVVGDTGFYVPFGDALRAVEGIQAALESDLGGNARERIKAIFSKEKRETELVRIIKELCNAKIHD